MSTGSNSEIPRETIAYLSVSRENYPRQCTSLQNELKRSAEPHGIEVLPVFLEDYEQRGELEEILLKRGVRGVITLAMSDADSYERFRWTDFSVVQLLTAHEPYLALPVVRPDLFRTMRDAGRRVMDAGSLTAAILLVETDQPSITDLRMRSAASLVQQEWEAKGVGDRRVLYARPGDDQIWAFVQEFSRNLPDVLVMQNNMIYWALKKAGIRVPEDLELISLTLRDRDPFAGYKRNYPGLAEAALNMLLQHLETDTRPPLPMPEVRVVSDAWVPGPSFPEDHPILAGN